MPPSVTLTIEPGVTLRFESRSDIMRGGSWAGLGELIVHGTLLAQGTPDAPITVGPVFPSDRSLASAAPGPDPCR